MVRVTKRLVDTIHYFLQFQLDKKTLVLLFKLDPKTEQYKIVKAFIVHNYLGKRVTKVAIVDVQPKRPLLLGVLDNTRYIAQDITQGYFHFYADDPEVIKVVAKASKSLANYLIEKYKTLKKQKKIKR